MIAIDRRTLLTALAAAGLTRGSAFAGTRPVAVVE
jgi:hypothetical protein